MDHILHHLPALARVTPMDDMKQILSNKIDKSQLKPGDHIYSWRTAWIYAHHGIYIGDDKVIHFTRGGGQEIGTGTVLDRIILSSSPSNSDNPCLKCGDLSNADGVISSCLNCFLSGGDLYLFKYSVSPAFFLAKARGGTCTLAPSDPPEDAIHRAKFLLENGFGVYNISKNNCEDFAIYCKTGLLVFTTISVGRSGQAASFLAATSAIVSTPLRFLTTSFSGLAVVGCGMYCVSRFLADIGIRRDVNRIPVERLVGCAREGLTEAVMDPQGCVTKGEETQGLVSQNSQVQAERVEVAQDHGATGKEE
ncbi:protein LEAD-SENSITIVE 1-like [Bidens hawaiensis]|uniref:protein LEAD-SENSITIVE 1-like n=1 Tax=Bidens hawaiensis TaxID=980011 RepID=UPI00404AA40A